MSLRLKRDRGSGRHYVVLAGLSSGNYQYFHFDPEEFGGRDAVGAAEAQDPARELAAPSQFVPRGAAEAESAGGGYDIDRDRQREQFGPGHAVAVT